MTNCQSVFTLVHQELIKQKVTKSNFRRMKTQDTQSSIIDLLVCTQASKRTCRSTKPASHVCFSKDCDKSAFTCGNQSCQCLEEHKQCPQLLIESIMSSIKAKTLPLDNVQKSIYEKIDKTIDALSELRQKIEAQIKKDITLYGVSIIDKNLFDALNQEQITGKIMFKTFIQAINDDSSFDQSESLDNKFGELWKSVDAQISKKSSQFFKYLESIKNGQQTRKIPKFESSKIKMTENDKQNLNKMFGNKVIRSVELLYRASENNFQIKKFHEKCDNIPDTLTLCETVHGKVIGGYTPLVWDQSKHHIQMKDSSGESFIFSLTNNHKFSLDTSQTAIFSAQNLGPVFGRLYSLDFYINNSANTNDSYAQINQSYTNENYTAKSGQSYMKFTGNPDKSYKFKTKDWEVWSLKF